MRDATNLWSAIRQSAAGDSRSLARHVKWLESDFVYYDSDPHVPLPPTSWLLGIPPDGRANSFGEEADTGELRTLAVIASRAHNSEWLRWFRAGECAMPARYYLQQSVNEKLRNRVSPKLLWNVPRSRPQDLALYLVSDNLLGAVWLQFAELINGNKPLRRCAACQSWIVISTEGTGRRSNRSTCSNACRMKIYEQRKKEAQRLRQQGLSAREIARLLRADQERVRKWIAATRTGQKTPNLKKR
jgi:hypothetical protein